MPIHADIPHQELIFLDEVDPTMSPSAIASAMYNAIGFRVRNYPITLDKFLERLPDVA